MERKIKQAVVLGAGTMGGGIAALLAGVGIKTYLLDIIPPDLSDSEKGNKKARNRIVSGGLDRVIKSKPALLFDKSDTDLITVGNIEDDAAEYLARADWIVEVVFEQLDVKKKTFSLIEKYKKPEALVSSNTSGISIRKMLEDASSELKKKTIITHFFNPVRYMRLLEIVPHPETDKETMDFFVDFGTNVLGKGVVIGKDTPNFIANRIGVHSILYLIKCMVEDDFKPEEIDKIFGPALGRPKSAIFRTADLVGLDVLSHVIKNMYESLEDAQEKEFYTLPDFMKKMIEQKYLGEKTKQGFYKKVNIEGKKAILVYDYKTGEYRSQSEVRFECLGKAKKLEGVGEKIKAVVSSEDKAGKLAWKVLAETLLYSANKIPEIADDVCSIDNAMKWGFNWQLGPFETWDAIGVSSSVERMEKEGMKVPPFVRDMLNKGQASFYKREEGRKVYFDIPSSKTFDVPKPSGAIFLQDIKSAQKIIKKLTSATLLDIGDGVLCLEFHSRMNSIDDDIVTLMNFALDEAKKNYIGLVLGNEGDTFCAGANVFGLLLAAQSKAWDGIDLMVQTFQNANMKMKYSEVPVVVAPFNMTLGGGLEITLHAPRIRAHSELYSGLVEFGMGLIPAGGGTKELWVRLVERIPQDAAIDLFPLLQKAFETIALAKVSTSAKEAYNLGFLREGIDTITLNKDKLIGDAKEVVLAMAKEGYAPKRERKVKVLGKSGYAAIQVGIKNFSWGGKITEHEEVMAKGLARVLTGGDKEEGAEVTEQHLLDLEREVFLQLLGTPKTQERIQTFLTTGKIIRN
ncbi:MAG: putative 3-hydroxyacyl-CoA dehydrogenase [candidate division WS2 bacterium]|nr:putative 3-hydroxyacyl-CoA dehydrogenase [Candidatus Lithacetigena glycinireducens]